MIIRIFFKKYKSIIAYIFFGVCTTLVNIITYRILYVGLFIPNVVSTVTAWFFAVLFAFVTNKLFVFCSKSLDLKIVSEELVKFFFCRIATGIIDVAVMYIAVDKMQWNALLWKLLSNATVILLNYAASKLVIFTKHSLEEKHK